MKSKMILPIIGVLAFGTLMASCSPAQEEQKETEKVSITVINGSGTGSYEKGKEITISTLVQLGKTFSGWTKNGEIVSTSLSYTFIANEDATFVATFKNEEEPPVFYAITVENGTGSGSYESGKSVTITANIPEGKEFLNWTKGGAEVSKENPYTFLSSKENEGTYVANFKNIEEPTTFNVVVNEGTGSGTYNVGASVTITANVKEGFTFEKWTTSDSQEITENPYTFNVSKDITFTAVYKANQKIASKMVAISDVHIKNDDKTSQDHFKKTLQYTLDNDIDVLLINGDLVNNNQSVYYDAADSCLEEVFGKVSKENRPEILFNMGNHEFYHGDTSRHQATIYDEEVTAFRNFANKWMNEPIEDNIYCRTIGDVNYILACPGPEKTDGTEDGHLIYLAGLGYYSDQDFADLKTYLDAADKTGNPIILGTHHPWGYTYGGPSYGMPNQAVVNKMHNLLANYPQIINLTSHTHYSSLHERAFDQTNYTSLNIGMHYKGKYSSTFERDENGELITYLNVNNRDLVNDPQSSAEWSKTHFGVGIDFGEDKMVAKRINYATGLDYAHGTWDIPYGITKENMHDKFYYEAGERSGEELTFPVGSELTLTPDVYASSTNLRVAFKDVTKPWAVEGYKVEVKGEDGTLLKTVWWQSMFWVGKDIAYNYSFDIQGIMNDSKYTVSVYPMDMFGHYCDPLTKMIETGSEKTDVDKAEEAAGDLFYTSTEFSLSSENLSLDRKCLDTYDGQPGYSLKITGNDQADGWPSIKIKLDKSIDLTNSGLSFYSKFEVAHKWVGIKLFDSNNTQITNQKDHDFKSTTFEQFVYSNSDLKAKLIDGESLSDVRYIQIFMNFEEAKGSIQKIYFDQLEVVAGGYDTYTSSTTLVLPEAVPNWHSSTKHLTFHTNTTSTFMFTLVKDGGDRVSAKVYVTIGDGTSSIIEGVQSGGWTITKNGSDFLVDIALNKMNTNSGFENDTAIKINFRDGFPLNIANIQII